MEIKETLNTQTSFRKWLHGNDMEAKYSFALAKTPQGLKMAPADLPLDGRNKDEIRKEISIEFGSEQPTGFQFTVEFSPVDNPQPIWVNQIEINTHKVVEMHFDRTECKLLYQPMGKRFYWKSTTEPSDKDEGDLSTKDALKVFAGISQIAEKYSQDFKPDGIIMAARHDANPARARIYIKIAERLATQKGAMVTTITPFRRDMKNPILVWFPKVLR